MGRCTLRVDGSDAHGMMASDQGLRVLPRYGGAILALAAAA